MTQQTVCPACGAPLEYEGENENITCGFCSADIAVIKEDDEIRFKVVGQPEPQKEVLSHVVGPVPPAPEQAGIPVEERTASDFPTFFSSSPSGPAASPSGFENPPGAQVYQPARPAGSSSTKWIWIVVGVLLGLCVLCACLAGAAVLLFNASGGMIY